MRSPAHQRHSRTGITRPIAERRDTSAVGVCQIFQIIKRAAACLEPLQQTLTGGLALVGVTEQNVPVAQRRVLFGKFFQTEDDRILGRGGPRRLWHDGRTGIAIAVNRNGALAAFFDRQGKALINQAFRAFRRQANTFFIRAGFGAQPEMRHRSDPFGLLRDANAVRPGLKDVFWTVFVRGCPDADMH